MFLACLKSDFLKTRHLSANAAYLVLPAATAVMFLLYYACVPWESLQKIAVFYQVQGIGLPFLTGLFCAMAADQEQSAGVFQNMLAADRRRLPFLSKLLLLLLFELGAVLLASGIFGVVFLKGFGNLSVNADFYFIAAVILWGSSIPMYVFHLFLALKFSRGISLGLGIVESLIAALLLTGLGDNVWEYVPSAWPARLPSVFLGIYSGDILTNPEIERILPIYLTVTAAATACFVIWSGRWEGTKTAR